MDALAFFQWLDGSTLAALSKANGGVFALVQTVHLAAMALLGGMVLLLDLRLLGIVMTGVPADTVVVNTRRWIGWALVAMACSGIYMASAVAIKLYYNMFFWSKMAGLAMGLAFLYGLKFPLLKQGVSELGPWTVRSMAAASLMIWFSVAASGRWIGFS